MAGRHETDFGLRAKLLGFRTEEKMFLKLYEEDGLSSHALGRMLGVAHTTILQRLHRYGVKMRAPTEGLRARRPQPRKLEHVAYEQLMAASAAEVARKYGVHCETVLAERRRRVIAKKMKEERTDNGQ